MLTEFEVIIIGGSYSGLSAAMSLGRTRRNVLVIDSGKPCNRHTPHSHNFITHDGETPAAISAKAKEQVLTYPTVSFLKDKAISAVKTETGFEVTTENNTKLSAKKLLFASGITDIMPNIEGFEDCWAISVVHCPYCHGYEIRDKKTGIFANGDAAWHYALLVSQMTKDLTIFTNGKAEFTAEQLQKLQEYNIAVTEDKVVKIKHQKGYMEELVFQDSTYHALEALYYKPPFVQHTNIPAELGCAINEQGYITVDEMQKTSIPGIYAAGDCTSMKRSVAGAVATGNMAGAAINMELSMESF